MTFDFGPIDQQECPSVTVEPVSTQTTQQSVPFVLRKPKGSLSRTTKTAINYINQYNLPARDAYQLVNGRQPSNQTAADLAQKARDFSLAQPAMRKMAHQVAFDILKGKPMIQPRPMIDKRTGLQHLDPETNEPMEIIDKVYPTHTNQVAVVNIVADRAEPVVRQNVNLNGNLKDFLPFRIDELG